MAKSNPHLGFHYYPDDRHFTREDLKIWLPILESLGAHWLTLRASGSRAVPEYFICGLLEAGIEPVIHLPARVGSLSAAEMAPILESYGRWGVRYVVLFDRPNVKTNWEYSLWGRKGLVERFIDHLLPFLKLQRLAGLEPVFPPLEPGGDYWDTSFLESSLLSMKRRGLDDLLKDLALGIYAWTYGRSLDWGKGGPDRWPEARPYHTPKACEDQKGFRISEWYAAISSRVIQSALPMVVVAGGALPARKTPFSVRPDPHMEQNLAIARMLETGEVSPQVANFSYYILATEPDHPDRENAWFPSLDAPRAVVPAMRKYAHLIQRQPKLSSFRPLQHYLLLPADASPDFSRRWAALGDIVEKARPAIGFSPREARLARRVTLAGDEQAIPEGIARMLRAAGCSVQRLPRALLNPALNQRKRSPAGALKPH